MKLSKTNFKYYIDNTIPNEIDKVIFNVDKSVMQINAIDDNYAIAVQSTIELKNNDEIFSFPVLSLKKFSQYISMINSEIFDIKVDDNYIYITSNDGKENLKILKPDMEMVSKYNDRLPVIDVANLYKDYDNLKITADDVDNILKGSKLGNSIAVKFKVQKNKAKVITSVHNYIKYELELNTDVVDIDPQIHLFSNILMSGLKCVEAENIDIFFKKGKPLYIYQDYNIENTNIKELYIITEAEE